MTEVLEARDEVFALIDAERDRQAGGLELIASENFTSASVREAVGSVLTNKYAEGYPKKRWYGGCEVVDKVEQLAIDRLKQLFGATWANVQPHSGSSANMAVYWGLLKPGDRVLGMDLAHGGHLTHGSPVNFSGQGYEVHGYQVQPGTETLDMDAVRQKALETRPRLIIAGASAYSRTLDFAAFRAIADEVGALFMADIAHIAGLVAAGVHPTPVGQAHAITSTTHKTLRGPRGGILLATDPELGKTLDRAVFPGLQGGPLEHVIAGKAVAFGEALQPNFKRYARQILLNARRLAEELAARGYRIVAGGTDNHMLLLDLRPQNLSGKDATARLGHAGITVSKSLIPFDPETPFVTSGIRLGTPALTTRGLNEDDMATVAGHIHQALTGDPAQVKEQVREFALRFELP